MKKAFALVMALSMAFSLVACGGQTASDAASSSASDAASASSSVSAPAEGGVKTGLGIAATAAVETEASADENGKVKTNATAAAVLVDAEGRILSAKLDMVQMASQFTTEGAVTPDTSSDVQSKQDLGADYGMIAKSEIGKEWFEQADAFAAYVVGMTADEVLALPAESSEIADLAATCTIGISDFQAAIAAAVNNAQELGASADDQLSLALVSDITGSDASADEDGKAQHNTTYAVTTTNAEGKITSSILDETQSKYTVTVEGVAAAASETVASKKQLGADYGMIAKSEIGKEWFEQADAFAAYVVGMTADEVMALPAESSEIADLAATCTIGIDSFKAALVKAAA